MPVVPGRYTAKIEGDFVVFMIGMRINRPWKVAKWWPVFKAMPPMLAALSKDPDKGLLGYRGGLMGLGPVIVQYWRSFDDLERFARDADDPHLEPWRRYVREVGSSGDVGIWHETYQVRAGEYECVYTNMPVVGLAKGTEHAPVSERTDTARLRMKTRRRRMAGSPATKAT